MLTVIPAHLLPFGDVADVLPRFAAAFRAVWSRWPAAARQRLLECWRRQPLQVIVRARPLHYRRGGHGELVVHWAACSGFALLRFDAGFLRRLDDDLLAALVAHELTHATGNAFGRRLTEAETDTLVERLGWPMQRLRRLA